MSNNGFTPRQPVTLGGGEGEPPVFCVSASILLPSASDCRLCSVSPASHVSVGGCLRSRGSDVQIKVKKQLCASSQISFFFPSNLTEVMGTTHLIWKTIHPPTSMMHCHFRAVRNKNVPDFLWRLETSFYSCVCLLLLLLQLQGCFSTYDKEEQRGENEVAVRSYK